MYFLGVDVERGGGGGGGVNMKKKTVPIVYFHLIWPILAI